MGVTLHFQTTGTVPGTGAPVAMNGASLTIGRGPENDVCLPDPGKVISKTHCTIEDRGGDIVVIDLSTNGTFLNYGKVALGTAPTPLNDGDILTMGSYELMIEILRAPRPGERAGDVFLQPLEDAAPARLPDDPSLDDLLGGDPIGGDDGFIDDLLGGGARPKGHSGVNRPELGEDGLLPPLGDDDLGLSTPEPEHRGATHGDHSSAVSDSFQPRKALIPDDWEDDLLGDLADPSQGDDPFATEAKVAPIPQDEPAADAPVVQSALAVDTQTPGAPLEKSVPPPRMVPAETVPVQTPPVNTDAARAFLAAAGAGDVAVSDADLPDTMARLGTVLRTMIHGLREILMTRASIKSEFRIQQTMITSGANNPLKFSISPEQAIETMVRPSAKGYLPPDEAARQALDDIKAHEIAMMAAMEAALKGVLKQLSPKVLEGQITKGGGLSSLLQGKKARYWDVYETMYAKISDQAETDFHELFSREFARAYQAQLDRLKPK